MKIMVMNSVQASLHGAADLMHKVDMDSHPYLALPADIKIGGRTWDGDKIEHYHQMVSEYDIWLEDQIKAQNHGVMRALDHIYGMAQGAGVVLTTICLPSPYHTHAHVVMRTINKLAGEPEDEQTQLQQRSEEGA